VRRELHREERQRRGSVVVPSSYVGTLNHTRGQRIRVTLTGRGLTLGLDFPPENHLLRCNPRISSCRQSPRNQLLTLRLVSQLLPLALRYQCGQQVSLPLRSLKRGMPVKAPQVARLPALARYLSAAMRDAPSAPLSCGSRGIRALSPTLSSTLRTTPIFLAIPPQMAKSA